jgi:LCP family protein required for cell wall assembly
VIAASDGARLHRTWPQRLLLLLNVVVVLACFATAGGLAYVDNKAGRLQRIALGSALSDDTVQPGAEGVQNILLVGVDSDAGLDPNDPRMQDRTATLNSDTIMLLRVDASQTKASLLSFPRDLWVPLGGDGQRSKINAALPIGGPDLLIRTITGNFGIPINHYVQVDFEQFQKLVDVIDGVPVPFDMPVRDEWTGLEIDQPGCVTLDGAHALDYVRSRHLEYYQDGRWQYDGAADLSRISRQQDFLQRAIKRATSKGLRNPITMNRLLDAALSSVTVDDQFKTSDIAALAARFRSFDPGTFQTYSLPVETGWAGDASIVRLIDRDAKPILDIFRGVGPGDEGPGSVQVTVLNGSGRSNEGRSTADALGGAGFNIDTVADAPETGQPHTTILYRPEDEAGAQLLARYLVVPPQLEPSADLSSDGVELVTGLDFAGVRSQPAPAPTTSSTAAAGQAGTDGGPATSTTSTTRVGIVPTNDQTDPCS